MKCRLAPLFDIDPARLRFTLRTAAAACLALVVAALLGLDHPQWAAMTVWVVSQPTRGQWLEKSLARIAGTIFGAFVGIGLVVFSRDNPALLIAGLAIWIGVCAGAGNLLSGPASYITLLSGYSAAMIAMLDHAHPDLVSVLAIDRVATICVGAASSTLTGFIFAPRAPASELIFKLRQLMTDVLTHAETMVAGFGNLEDQPQLLSRMAAIEEMLTAHAAGSLSARKRARHTRRLLSNLMTLLIELRTRPVTSFAALHVENDDKSPDITHRLAVLSDRITESSPQIAGLLMATHDAWTTLNDPANRQTREDAAPAFLVHRDWIGARHAALRAAGSVILVGLLWIATGWEIGPLVVMGAAIMTSLFSTFENPASQMRWVATGSVAGALAAIFAHTVVLPFASNALHVVLLTMPFVLIGAFVMAHRRTVLAGMDFNMSYLLLMGPVFPIDPQAGHILQMAGAVVLGPVLALAAFRFAFPVDAGRRLDFIVRLIVDELVAISAGREQHKHGRSHWRARLYHRTLRLVRWAERSGPGSRFAANGGIAAIGVGDALLTARHLVDSDAIDPSARRAIRAAMMSVAHLPTNPDRTATAFGRASQRLGNLRPADAEIFREMSALITENGAFFRRAA